MKNIFIIFCSFIVVSLNAQDIGFSQSISSFGYVVPVGKTLLIHTAEGGSGGQTKIIKINGGSYYPLGLNGNSFHSPIVVSSGKTVSANYSTYVTGILKVENPIGINESISMELIRIFPNPTNGIVTIDLGETKSNLNLTLTNALGQVVLTKNYSSTNHINLDLDAPKGIYFLQLEVDGDVITKKVVKE